LLLRDLRMWGMKTKETGVMVHLILPDGRARDRFLTTLNQASKARNSIDHAAFQIETEPNNHFVLAPAQVLQFQPATISTLIPRSEDAA
jgi:hypothetical protein